MTRKCPQKCFLISSNQINVQRAYIYAKHVIPKVDAAIRVIAKRLADQIGFPAHHSRQCCFNVDVITLFEFSFKLLNGFLREKKGKKWLKPLAEEVVWSLEGPVAKLKGAGPLRSCHMKSDPIMLFQLQKSLLSKSHKSVKLDGFKFWSKFSYFKWTIIFLVFKNKIILIPSSLSVIYF